MAVCTFFGHKDTPKEIAPALHAVLVQLVEQNKVDTFYVGNHGDFDSMVRSALKLLKRTYPHIRYAVVLAYLPIEKRPFDPKEYADTIYPDGLENTPPRFAISKRNRWMIAQSDYVVTYVTHSFGGAAQFETLAKKQGKTVIKLTEKIAY